jgi:hypothetical protein
MSRGQQGTDRTLCWNCGEAGSFLFGSQMYCRKCDVTWMPWSSESIINLDEAHWDGRVVECVDFTEPNALSCPA